MADKPNVRSSLATLVHILELTILRIQLILRPHILRRHPWRMSRIQVHHLRTAMDPRYSTATGQTALQGHTTRAWIGRSRISAPDKPLHKATMDHQFKGATDRNRVECTMDHNKALQDRISRGTVPMGLVMAVDRIVPMGIIRALGREFLRVSWVRWRVVAAWT